MLLIKANIIVTLSLSITGNPNCKCNLISRFVNKLAEREETLSFSTFLYLYVPTGCIVVLVCMVFVGTAVKLGRLSKVDTVKNEFAETNRGESAEASRQEGRGRNNVPSEESIESLDMEGYEEIDTASYQSVTWRDYSLDESHDENQAALYINPDINDAMYININSYEDLRHSAVDKQPYDKRQSSEA